ncbi:MAG: IS4 family transposase [Actinobacteria bacterium]|nr:IS4 family transposase [Actinomycetota bacterium]
MHRTDAIAWVVSVCAASLRLSQAKTLAVLVASAMRVERVSLANIGRQMLGGVKHQVKRCWRFCANERVETADAMRGVVKKALRKRKKPLLVSLDWTDVRQFQTLAACVVLKGRSVPLCWASCTKHVYDGHRSRNAFEEGLLLVLRSMIPAGQKVILLADRGFGRTELARFCQRHGFDYVIRIQPNVHVRCASFSGKLLDYPVHKGICKLLRSVEYRSHHPVEQNIVVRWVRDLPPKRDECWFLMSSLSAGPARLSRLYGQRMTIEELFRDQKNKRNGWSLRDTKITRADRLDRLLLVLAIAYLLLCGVGLIAEQTHAPGAWSASSRSDCSVFTIGRVMVERLTCSAPQAFHALVAATEEAVPKWG